MKRNIDLNEISDGKLYESNDMVKVGCDGCEGCSKCCQGMGSSIVLDPLDIYRLTNYLGVSFETLLLDAVELNVVDGIVLPNLKMTGSGEKCAFLNEHGRCSVHSARPGICRLFPLGRIYENRDFKYFIQLYECPKKNKTKVKVRKWLDMENIAEYEKFIKKWHYMLEDLQIKIKETNDESIIKSISMYVLKMFYMTTYEADDNIFVQLERRIAEIYSTFNMPHEL